ncbi:hypothetical protein [Dyadobacter endophyticus]|nr:hypothetical protein [Dyadobacter endophyticus]
MKKLFLLLLPGMLLLAGSAEAQLQKGTVHWGTTITANGNNMKNEAPNESESKSSVTNIYPSLQTGWFTRDNFMFGLRLSTSHAFFKTSYDYPGSSGRNSGNSLAVNLTPFIRKYKPISPKWALYLHSGVNLAYLRSKMPMEGGTKYDNGYSGGVYINPGVVFWVTPRFALESDFNVLSLSANYVSFRDQNQFNLNAGVTSSISQYFGIRAAWYLQPK